MKSKDEILKPKIYWVMRCKHCDVAVKWDINKGNKGGWKHQPTRDISKKGCKKLEGDEDTYRSWEKVGTNEKVDPPYEQE